MLSKSFITSMTAATLLLSPTAGVANINSFNTFETVDMAQVKETASVNLAQQEALNLLVYTTLLSKEVGPVAEIPQGIKDKYETATKLFFASPSIVAAGYGTLALSGESLEELVSIFQPLTALFRVMAKYVNMSAEFSSEVVEKLIPEWVFESSSKSLEAVADLVQAILKPLFTAGVGYSVGSLTVGGSLYSSVFVTMNTASEAMTYEQVRSLLGYDKELGYKIDKVTAQLGQVFTLTPEKEQKFKEDLLNAIIEEGIRTDFNTDAMDVDTFEVLKPQLSQAEVNVVSMLKAVYDSTKDQVSAADSQSLEKDVVKLFAVAAVLETILETKNLTREQRSEVALRLANAKETIKQIERNMR